MESTLAIVIPAYKSDFFEQTLESIAKQTCKDFILYIGDDASPNDIYSIVKKFEDRISIVFKRFEDNLGGKDLVAQWERCIAMTQNEEWIWLFSDDDLMESKCVEIFYKTLLEQSECFELYRFPTRRINEKGELISEVEKHPLVESALDFLKRRLTRAVNSYMVEYIFSRKVYHTYGIIKFPLAWASDDATWISYASRGIYSMDSCCVFWRYSGSNISSVNDGKMNNLKIKASRLFICWAHHKFNGRIDDALFYDWLLHQCKIANKNNNVYVLLQIFKTRALSGISWKGTIRTIFIYLK